MASPSDIFTQMVSTTHPNISRELVDAMSNHNALINRLRKKGKIEKMKSGGRFIQRPIEYRQNGNKKWFSGYDTFDTTPQDIITSVMYNLYQFVITFSASGQELRQNSGPEAFINLFKAKKQNVIKTAANELNLSLYSEGLGQNEMQGLPAFIQNNGQGTVGGLDSSLSVNSFWRNQFKELSGTNTWTGAELEAAVRSFYITLTRNQDKTDLILSSIDFYTALEGVYTQLRRYGDSDLAQSGFTALKVYDGCDVVYDVNANFTSNAEKMYFLNTDYIYLIEHEEAWKFDDPRKPVNQDAVIVPMFWVGNMICTNRARQGVLIDAA